jgi:N-acetylglucosamine-6-phosphate deacetylase
VSASSHPPALVDLQVNGWHGTDFSADDLYPAQVVDVAERLHAAGTSGFLATVVSAPVPVLLRNLALLAALADGPLRGTLLGVHLEGPFIAPDDRVLGAHRRRHVLLPDPDLLASLVDAAAGHLRLLTLAAELPGAERLVRVAVGAGVTVSIGHSWATGDDLARAAGSGATALTHWGNALPAVLDKRANPLLAGLLCRDLTPMIIADGHHLSPDLLALVLRVRDPHDVVLVSDTASAGGLAPGRHQVLGQEAELTVDGALRNHREGHLVGSAATLLRCVELVAASGEVTPAQARAMASTQPLELIGLTGSVGRTGTVA